VFWVWSPNVSYENSTPLAGLYPGDEYVDWIGLSGYYGTVGAQQYRTFDQIFDPTIAQLRTFTQRPLVITEVGATDQAGRKAEWVQNFLTILPRHADIIGFIWYEAVKETDWRIAGTAAGQAFAAGVAGPRYDIQWSPNSVPRTWLSRVGGASSQSPPASRTPGRR
jgi:mannan endo-1,4-beta-mannosidase